jgi:hypothetical protein
MNAPTLCTKCHRSVGFSVETGLCFWHENMRLEAELERVRGAIESMLQCAVRNSPCMQCQAVGNAALVSTSAPSDE